MESLPRVVLLLESSRGSGRALLRGIANYARHHGPWAFYWEPRGLADVLPRLDALAPQGFILRDCEHLDKILELGMPTIVVGHSKREVTGVVNVLTDSEATGRMAAEHLLGCGFQNFGYCGFEDLQWSMIRAESFQKHIASVHFKTHIFTSNSLASTTSWEHERKLMVEWLRSLPKPVGVMACNDDHAQKVIEACKTAGLHVPDQVGVIGADNDELVCELFGCPISSVVINFESAGYESARILDEWMRGKAPKDVRIIAPASHVVPRQSTDTLAVQDAKVARALRFITEHAKENVGVLDVARAVGLSRRALEKRFRGALSRSILQEIRRIRVGLIARMLVETDLPISHIAEAQGYENVQHIARYFRQEKGMSPAAFRKSFRRR
jgi:LacI family transcriptional regulator